MNLDQSIRMLGELYSKCPPVPCTKCGACCVSPHMSFVEFVYFLDGMFKRFSREELAGFVSSPLTYSVDHEGHLTCKMKKDDLCMIWPHRNLSCRMEGLAVLDQLFGRDKPVCIVPEVLDLTRQTGSDEVLRLITAVTDLNRLYFPFYEPPYYLDTLNLECWFAVLLDPGITQALFLKLRELITKRHNLSFLAEQYIDLTHLKEKLDLIDRFYALQKSNKHLESLKAVQRIRSDFPATGTYFYFIALGFEEKLTDRLINSQVTYGDL